MPRILLAIVAATAAVALTTPAPAAAQASPFEPGPWQRVDTRHFTFLFPDDLADWTLPMARRMESVHDAVEAFVGHAPESRTTVLVDDPGNVSNGSMVPGPLLFLWPTPPGPRSVIGENRGWSEILAVHEFTHAAHLTRRSRNPVTRALWSLIPIPVTRFMATTPRWVTEGYATYVEGKLTGSGRPHGAWRAAVLRTWALDGELPSYRAMSGTGGYWGGSMAYLVGSAYLQWLVQREARGEQVLPDLWARLSARQVRGFGDAFGGVFGALPEELYGHFKVAVTGDALAVRAAVEAAGGPVQGRLFQRLDGSTGDPAVSPDGRHMAVVLRPESEPSRLVVISTTPDTLTVEEREAREHVFERDPQDVRPVEGYPRAQEPVATLRPAFGQEYHAPAWLPDGSGILVVRSDMTGNGRMRPGLFLWRWETGGVRRLTRGAAIRHADPAPGGTWAVALRCLHGQCDIVRVDLESGDVATLAAGGPMTPFDHPRVSPDGRTIVASEQDGAGWHLVALDADGGRLRRIGPDDGASRFDAGFLPDGRLVLTSDRGGIHNLEILDLATGEAHPLTRVLGAAVAPAPTPDGDVFFLALHSRGWDIRRIALDSAPAGPALVLPPAYAPAIPEPREPGDTFAPGPIGPVRPYGLGPRFHALLPMTSLAVDGLAGGLALGGTDPIGRLSWQLQGMYGSDDAWKGASLRLFWRGTRPWLHLSGFWADQLRREDPLIPPLPLGADSLFPLTDPVGIRLRGALAALELQGEGLAHHSELRVGGSAAAVDAAGLDGAGRYLGFGEYGLTLRQRPFGWGFDETVLLHGSIGRTGSLDWRRWVAGGELALAGDDARLALAGTLGHTDAPLASPEAFQLGGSPPLLFDPALLSQRLTMPALPVGFLRGRDVRIVRAELSGALPFTAFYWAGDAGDDGLGWYYVAGGDVAGRTPAMPFLRLPSAEIRAGVARTLSSPERGEWRGWLVLGFRP